MRITVIGAAGSAGSRIVKEALVRGHQVTAVVRNKDQFSLLPNEVVKYQADASLVNEVIEVSKNQDLVIAATRPAEGHEKELLKITQALLTASAHTQVRLIAMGGAGSLIVKDKANALVVDDIRHVSPAWRNIAQACVEQYQLYQANSQVDWCYISPPAMLVPGIRTGKFRLGKDELIVDNSGKSEISIEDLAKAVIDEAENKNFPQQRFTLGY
jgi:putative NADH-flavin reductase